VNPEQSGPGGSRTGAPVAFATAPKDAESAFGDGHHTSGAKNRPGSIFAPRRHSLSRGLRMQHRRGKNIGDPFTRCYSPLAVGVVRAPRVGAFDRSALFPELDSDALRMRSATTPRDAHTESGFSTARGAMSISRKAPSGSVRTRRVATPPWGRNTCRAEFRRRM
jgi:hypothetical protein